MCSQFPGDQDRDIFVESLLWPATMENKHKKLGKYSKHSLREHYETQHSKTFKCLLSHTSSFSYQECQLTKETFLIRKSELLKALKVQETKSKLVLSSRSLKHDPSFPVKSQATLYLPIKLTFDFFSRKSPMLSRYSDFAWAIGAIWNLFPLTLYVSIPVLLLELPIRGIIKYVFFSPVASFTQCVYF